MSRHQHHGHSGRNQSSSYGSGAPSYSYDPLQQALAAPYGQQMNPVYGQPSSHGGYGQQVMPHQQPSSYGVYPGQELQYVQAEEHRHRENEHRAEMGALGAVAFAAVSSCRLHLNLEANTVYKHHEANTVYEHHEANTVYKQESELGGVKHHGHHHRH